MNKVWTDGSPGWSTYGQEQTENATEIYNYLTGNGCTQNAAYAIIGNMQKESYINPAQWQIGSNYDPSQGFGLCQWTPSTKISNITGTDPDAMSNYTVQLDYLLLNGGQWSTVYVDVHGWSNYYQTSVPYITSLNDFLTDTTHTVEELTKAFCCCWERPSAQYADIQTRVNYAYHWAGGSPPPPPPPLITPAILIVLLRAAILWRFT